MKWQNVGELRCPIARTLSIIGDRWTLLILRNAFMKMRRFDDFQTSLDVPKHILSTRLKKLVDAQVLQRVAYQQAPLRYEYRLTERGRELYPLVLVLAGWGNKWMGEDKGALIEYTHTECGHVFHPVVACSECGEEIKAKNVLVSTGPGLLAEPATNATGE